MTLFAASTYFNPRSPHGERPTSETEKLSTRHFNPRSPHGERREETYATISYVDDFNPRSPHGERLLSAEILHGNKTFQPTLPARGATPAPAPVQDNTQISTHAPRTGSDTIISCVWRAMLFQPTLPARGATRLSTRLCRMRTFQPTLPARGATRIFVSNSHCIGYFNPRSPHGERRTPKLQGV